MKKHEIHGSNGNDGKAKSHTSHASHGAGEPDPHPSIIPPRGDYQTLLSYQKAAVVYDLTYHFCGRFFKKGDRTTDQMVQAARSDKQNIIEGSKAAMTSKETEIKLTNVARASQEELLEDYRDFLRVRDLPIWDKNSREARYVRNLSRKTPLTYEDFREFCETRPAETVANIAICLIHQTNYLLDQQLTRLEKDFLKDGGQRERHVRRAAQGAGAAEKRREGMKKGCGER
jgi:four helix bundle suffix protein